MNQINCAVFILFSLFQNKTAFCIFFKKEKSTNNQSTKQQQKQLPPPPKQKQTNKEKTTTTSGIPIIHPLPESLFLMNFQHPYSLTVDLLLLISQNIFVNLTDHIIGILRVRGCSARIVRFLPYFEYSPLSSRYFGT